MVRLKPTTLGNWGKSFAFIERLLSNVGCLHKQTLLMVINLATKILGADNVQVYLRSNEMTTGNLEILLKNLRKAVIEEASVAAIDAALFGLSSYHNPQSIEVVLGLLDDTFDADEGMFSLIHAAEAFDDSTYVEHMLVVLPSLKNKAPKWASIIMMRAINNQTTRDALVKAVRVAGPEVKQAVMWLCEKINQRSVEFVSKTLPVILAAK
ncbi:Imm30 family immunity protein [Ralstonia pseudosolanacearum]